MRNFLVLISALVSVTSCLVSFSTSAPVSETPPKRFEVKSLPGWVGENDDPAPLPSRMFTGYLDAGTPPSGVGTMYFHYWLVESERDPKTDGVLIWYNGGP